MINKQEEYRRLPAVDKMLQRSEIQEMIQQNGLEQVTELLREKLTESRQAINNGNRAIEVEDLISACRKDLNKGTKLSLKPVINGSGIVLHTNLGRAPLGAKIFEEMKPIVEGYSNLEYDLEKGRRGQRNDHVRDILRKVTGAEDAVVVNNNAAAVMLVLKTLAEGREVVVSRGEQIEIGGAFRIPDIMAESGAEMVEVGCTNRTKLTDYENALTERTALLFKAHKSNYYIGGFCEEVELKDLVELAHARGLFVFYDIGSGLLRKPEVLKGTDEPDVRSALAAGVDVISFSGDKLLGGAQAGIIAGKQSLIEKISKAPMMRALRVGKLTIAALLSVIRAYLSDKELVEKLPLFEMLNRSLAEKEEMAQRLAGYLNEIGVRSKVVDSYGRCGGGTMPSLQIKSRAVRLYFADSDKPEQLFYKLLTRDEPLVGILREGDFLIDVMSLQKFELEKVAGLIAKSVKEL